MAKIQRNDQVIVIAGNNKGKKARVLRVLTDKNRVLLEGIQGDNLRMIKKHVKPNPQTGAQGSIQELNPTVHISNVMLLDAEGKASRVGYTIVDGKKVRVTKSNGQQVAATK
ncbi:50S ribosomal protein L24 [Granulicella cerasi]|uniref:Large ribosomal subunit protein uL24 n=1 Tax=Granulicella cerasi TaxID=741063 RepID=A0ABW1ZCU3_9BACT|nr:50S ribosomal protein L24 [Granulicella cerasi]